MKRGSRKSGFAGMSPESRHEAQSRGGKEAQRRRKFARQQLLLPGVDMRTARRVRSHG